MRERVRCVTLCGLAVKQKVVGVWRFLPSTLREACAALGICLVWFFSVAFVFVVLPNVIFPPEPRSNGIGIVTRDPTPDEAKSLGWGKSIGAYVSDVIAGSLADNARLAPKDIIVAVDGYILPSAKSFTLSIDARHAEGQSSLTIIRGGEAVQLLVKDLGTAPRYHRVGSKKRDAALRRELIVLEESSQRASSPPGAIIIAQEAVRLALDLDDSAAKIRSISKLAALFSSQQNYPDAVKTYYYLIDLITGTHGVVHPTLVEPLISLGIIDFRNGKLALSQLHFERAEWQLTKTRDSNPANVVTVNTFLGVIYQRSGLPGTMDQAIAHFMRAIDVADKANQPALPDAIFSRELLAAVHMDGGRSADAEPLLRAAIAGLEKTLGTDHPRARTALLNLARAQQNLGRYAEAEEGLQRIVLFLQQAPTTGNVEHAQVLAQLGGLYVDLRRLSEAESTLKKSLALVETAPLDSREAITIEVGALLQLGRLAFIQSKFSDAQERLERSRTILEKSPEPDRSRLGQVLGDLATVYAEQGRLAEADDLLDRSLDLIRSALGYNDPLVGFGLSRRALLGASRGREHLDVERWVENVLKDSDPAHHGNPIIGETLVNASAASSLVGNLGEAEQFAKRALLLMGRPISADQTAVVGAALLQLASVYLALGRADDAQALSSRAYATLETLLGVDHPRTSAALYSLANSYRQQGRSEEAERLLKQARSSMEKVGGPRHLGVAQISVNLGWLYYDAQRNDDADVAFKLAMDIYGALLPADHRLVRDTLIAQASVHTRQSRYNEASVLLDRAARIAFDDDSLFRIFQQKGLLDSTQGRWEIALSHFMLAESLFLSNATRAGSYSWGRSLTHASVDPVPLNQVPFLQTVATSFRVAAETSDSERRSQITGSAFVSAQRAVSSDVAAAMAKMAVRNARQDVGISRLLRERQDLVGEWVSREKSIRDFMSEERNPERVKAHRLYMKTINERVAEIDATLAKDFPEFSDFANPAPLSIAEVQEILLVDEALIFVLDDAGVVSGREKYVWVVTKTMSRSKQIEFHGATLADRVMALRCGLDSSQWSGSENSKRCADLVGAYPRGSEIPLLPFHLGIAHDLYKLLLEPFDDLIDAKHLLVVGSGPMTSLPLGVLVTQPVQAPLPKTHGDYRDVAWLVRRHPITVLPSVSTLRTLRRHAQHSGATKPFIGFGNPLLIGKDDNSAGRAKLARDRQACSAHRWPAVAGLVNLFGVLPRAGRAGLADTADIRTQQPLPETADELCAVAHDLGAVDTDVHLGSRATEHALKTLSEAGSLAAYRTVHFATHGTLAGELRSNAEPGLILTPPAKASLNDDGYLSSSEIAGLKLDADLVILSACNTAAAGKPGAQALSGMARAFFYAGARSLLVSHWAVFSDATTTLITTALRTMASTKNMGRSEALRQSMLTLLDNPTTPGYAHPQIWAPFEIVGEGARTGDLK